MHWPHVKLRKLLWKFEDRKIYGRENKNELKYIVCRDQNKHNPVDMR